MHELARIAGELAAGDQDELAGLEGPDALAGLVEQAGALGRDGERDRAEVHRARQVLAEADDAADAVDIVQLVERLIEGQADEEVAVEQRLADLALAASDTVPAGQPRHVM